MTIKEAITEIKHLDPQHNNLHRFVFDLLQKGKPIDAVFHYRKALEFDSWMLTNDELKKQKRKRRNKRMTLTRGKTGSAVSKHNRALLYRRQNGRCAHCGEKRYVASLEADHITPVFKGGTNDIENFQLLCRDCHRVKDKDIIELSNSQQINEHTLSLIPTSPSTTITKGVV